MQGKVAVLGSNDFVMPFSALGVDTFAVENDGGGIAETATEILKQRYSMVVIAENIAPKAQEIFEKTVKQPVPCVVVVPFTTESEGFATKSLGRLLKMATGINILAD